MVLLIGFQTPLDQTLEEDVKQAQCKNVSNNIEITGNVFLKLYISLHTPLGFS